MRRLLSFLLTLLALAPRTSAEPPLKPSATRDLHSVQVGFLLHTYDYKEVWAPPAKSNESGWLTGAALRYMYHGEALPLFGRINLEFVQSRTDYHGGLQGPDGRNIPYNALTKNIFRRVEFDAGYALNDLANRFDLIMYSGFGYRFWRRNLAFGLPVDYIEDYSWKYLPLGIRGEYSDGVHWSAAVDAAMRIMFGGRLEIMEQFGDPVFELGSVLGARVQIPITYRFGGSWMATIEAWYETSGIEESPVVVTQAGEQIREPSSRSHLLGFTFMVGVRL